VCGKGVTGQVTTGSELSKKEWWVANPVHPGEDSVDKWNEKPERKDVFQPG
jgi:hypothetical protein